jgi:hypothetical protein
MRAFCPAALASGPAKSLKFREIAFRACVMTGEGRKPWANTRPDRRPAFRMVGRRARNVATRQVSTGPRRPAATSMKHYLPQFPAFRSLL